MKMESGAKIPAAAVSCSEVGPRGRPKSVGQCPRLPLVFTYCLGLPPRGRAKYEACLKCLKCQVQCDKCDYVTKI